MSLSPFADTCQRITRLLLARYLTFYQQLLPSVGSHAPLSGELLQWLQSGQLAHPQQAYAWERELLSWQGRLASLCSHASGDAASERWASLFRHGLNDPLATQALALLLSLQHHPQLAFVVRHLSGWPHSSGLERTFLALLLDPLDAHAEAIQHLLSPEGSLASLGLLTGLDVDLPSEGTFLALDPMVTLWLEQGIEASCQAFEGLSFVSTELTPAEQSLEAANLLPAWPWPAPPLPQRLRLHSVGEADLTLHARRHARQIYQKKGLLTLRYAAYMPWEHYLNRLRTTCLLAHVQESAVLLVGLDALERPLQAQALAQLSALLKQAPLPLLLADSAPLDVPGFSARLAKDLRADLLEIAFPNARQRQQAWHLLSPLPPSTLERLATFPLSYEHLLRLAPSSLETKQLAHRCREAVGHRVGQWAKRVSTKIRWQDVVLPAPIEALARELIAFARFRSATFEAWGLAQSTGSLTALFSGPPGTGKTMLAGLIAKELGLDLFHIDVSRLVSKYVGETEARLGQLFAEASRGGVALLFDEADSLFAKRTEVQSATDRYANMEVSFLLQKLDSFEGLAILTTNFSQSLDESLRRRIRFHARFQMPTPEEREALWQAMLPAQTPKAPQLDLYALAHAYEFTGAEIKNASLRAAFLAASAQKPLDLEVLDHACRLECEERGRLVLKTAFDFQ